MFGDWILTKQDAGCERGSVARIWQLMASIALEGKFAERFGKNLQRSLQIVRFAKWHSSIHNSLVHSENSPNEIHCILATIRPVRLVFTPKIFYKFMNRFVQEELLHTRAAQRKRNSSRFLRIQWMKFAKVAWENSRQKRILRCLEVFPKNVNDVSPLVTCVSGNSCNSIRSETAFHNL